MDPADRLGREPHQMHVARSRSDPDLNFHPQSRRFSSSMERRPLVSFHHKRPIDDTVATRYLTACILLGLALCLSLVVLGSEFRSPSHQVSWSESRADVSTWLGTSHTPVAHTTVTKFGLRRLVIFKDVPRGAHHDAEIIHTAKGDTHETVSSLSPLAPTFNPNPNPIPTPVKILDTDGPTTSRTPNPTPFWPVTIKPDYSSPAAVSLEEDHNHGNEHYSQHGVEEEEDDLAFEGEDEEIEIVDDDDDESGSGDGAGYDEHDEMDEEEANYGHQEEASNVASEVDRVLTEPVKNAASKSSLQSRTDAKALASEVEMEEGETIETGETLTSVVQGIPYSNYEHGRFATIDSWGKFILGLWMTASIFVLINFLLCLFCAISITTYGPGHNSLGERMGGSAPWVWSASCSLLFLIAALSWALVCHRYLGETVTRISLGWGWGLSMGCAALTMATTLVHVLMRPFPVRLDSEVRSFYKRERDVPVDYESL